MIRKIFIAFNIIFMFNINLFCKDFNIFNSEQYILSSYLDALKQENREKVRENIPNFTDFSFYNDDGDVYLEWYKIMPIERMCYNQLLNIALNKMKNDYDSIILQKDNDIQNIFINFANEKKQLKAEIQ